MRALDLAIVHENAVAASQVFDGDVLTAHAQNGVLSRHHGIVERQLTAGTSADQESTVVKLEIVLPVSEPKAHAAREIVERFQEEPGRVSDSTPVKPGRSSSLGPPRA